MENVPSWESSFVTGTEVLRSIHATKRTELTMRDYEGREVVTKRFKMCDDEALERYRAEVGLLCKLSESCSRVIRPVAYITKPPTYAVVLPFFVHGSLDTILHSPKYTEISWELRLQFCLDMALAVQHCHDSGIIIRDVKPANMLVDEHYNCRIGDLELAKPEEDLANPTARAYSGPSSRRKTRFEGTPEYMAPELLKAPGSQLQRGIVKIAKDTDIFSMGISINEVITSIVPYTDVRMTTEQLHTVVETRYTPNSLHNAIVTENLRPSVTEHAQLAELCNQCWSADPTARPLIGDVVKVLQATLPASHKEMDRTQHIAYNPDTTMDEVDVQPIKKSAVRTWREVVSSLAASPPDGRPGVVPPCVAGSGEGTTGRRDAMEDDWFMHVYCEERSGARVFGVLDGHGGSACAKFVKSHLPAVLGEQILSMEGNNFTAALQKTFEEVQRLWLVDKQSDDSGACCTVALIVEAHVWLAWCGDCTAVACRGGEAVKLSKDHHPTDADERARIEAAGGTLQQTRDGKWRVNGRVAVSRAFGDKPDSGVVTPRPSVVHYPLRRIDEMLIIATDGVWDVLTPDTVVANLQKTVKHFDYGAKRVVCDAFNAGSADNIGAAVIYFTEA